MIYAPTARRALYNILQLLYICYYSLTKHHPRGSYLASTIELQFNLAIHLAGLSFDARKTALSCLRAAFLLAFSMAFILCAVSVLTKQMKTSRKPSRVVL